MNSFSSNVKNNQRMIFSFLIAFITLAVWYYLTLDQSSQEKLIFPGLHGLIKTTISNYQKIAEYSLITFYRIITGLLIGSTLGFFIGLLMTWNEFIEYLLDPYIETIRPIPPIALTPFFILWFGLGDLGQLLLVALGCFMVIIVTTVVSAKNVSPIYIRAAKSLGASKFKLYQTIIVPAIMPNIASAIRIAAATGFGLTVAAEYLGAQGGLGYMIRNARVTLETESILIAALILGLESLILDQLLRYTFNKLTAWLPKDNEQNK